MDIKYYLHLYIGCDILLGDRNWKPETNLGNLRPDVNPNFGHPVRTKLDYHILQTHKPDQITPILRQITSMTKEERGFMCIADVEELKGGLGSILLAPSEFFYLLSKHFDLFGLIKAGLALDATTIQTQNA